jgi:hypothetical protein
MTQEDKELLLQDLCGRLPYGVICLMHKVNGNDCNISIVGGDIDLFSHQFINIKPYLRSMSSMTKEEEKEYNSFIIGQQPDDCDFSAYPIEYKILYEDDIDSYIDWLNAHHFDYRGLIEKGLALKAPEGMYNLK